jgi:hypothetical protein
MRCSTARQVLELQRTGDAGAREAASAAAHVERCADCRRVEEAAVPPLRSIRNELPLHESDFVGIRANVMAEVRQNERRSFLLPFRLAIAAAVVLLLALGTFIAVRRAALTSADRKVPFEAAKPATTHQPAPAASAGSTQAQSETAVASMEPRPLHRPRDLHRNRHSLQTAPAVAAFATQPAPVAQIEIHTADPDIRIIWIANQTVETESKSL